MLITPSCRCKKSQVGPARVAPGCGCERLGDRTATSLADLASMLGLEHVVRHQELSGMDTLHLVEHALTRIAFVTIQRDRPLDDREMEIDAFSKIRLGFVVSGSHLQG